MITPNVSGMSSRNLHTYLGSEYKIYKRRMCDRIITMHIGAQYNLVRLPPHCPPDPPSPPWGLWHAGNASIAIPWVRLAGNKNRPPLTPRRKDRMTPTHPL